MANSTTEGIEKIGNQQRGYLVIDWNENILASSGDLSNDGKSASLAVELARLATKYVQLSKDNTQDDFKRITITAGDAAYLITCSNRKVFVSKQTIS